MINWGFGFNNRWFMSVCCLWFGSSGIPNPKWQEYLYTLKGSFKLNFKSLFLCLRWSCHKHCLRPMRHNTKQLKTPFRVKFAGIWETNWIFLQIDKILHPRLNAMLYKRTMKRNLETKPEKSLWKSKWKFINET